MFVTKHGLKIPNEVKEYEDFAVKMKESEEAFRKDLLECCV